VQTKLEQLAKVAIDCGFQLHKELGPGLLESVYELLLCEAMRDRGLFVEGQKVIPISYNGRVLEQGFRADILVERTLLIEVKSTEKHAAVHAKQVLTYLRLMKLPLGLLMNFGMETFRDGVKRLANDYYRPLT
jgi:GxxExxY protein